MGIKEPNIKIVKVKRIVKSVYYFEVRWSLIIVDFKYFVDGKGPYDIHGEPFKEPKKNTFWDYIHWILGGFQTGL